MTPADVLLAADGLSVWQGKRCLLQPLSFQLRAGEVLVLLGQSGAGKSLLARALMGLMPQGLQARGEVQLAGQRSAAADAPARRPLWGRQLAWLPQEPAVALDELRRLQPQLAEVLAQVRGLPPAQALAQSQARLQGLGLAEAAGLYPWQLSGGMAQRAATGIALAGGAPVVLADEPTKGLNRHWRERAAAQLAEVPRQGGALLLITHDLALARRVGGRTLVLREGALLEEGGTHTLLAAPTHDFTRSLLAADPAHWPLPTAAPPSGEPLLQAQGLGHRHDTRWLFRSVSLALHAGERLALLGDSGSGKTTLGQALLGLLAPREGHVQRHPALGPHAVQKLYQDPLASFAPTLPLQQALGAVARRHGQPATAPAELLQRLGLDAGLLHRLPQAVSGGELQRIALARALLSRPRVLFADEPTSRLDPLSQQQTLAVMSAALQDQQAALMLVTHDEDLARAVAPRVLRLVSGRRG
jgi:peptide/nickel transport system ATP-binding protein